MSDQLMFNLLHTLRMKGGATAEALSAILQTSLEETQAGLAELVGDAAAREIKTPRGVNYALTDAGIARHLEEFAALRTPASVAALEPVYERFLAINGELKTLCAAWQSATPGDDAARWEAIDGLIELHVKAVSVLTDAGAVEDRYARYKSRLDAALSRLQNGDDRFFTGLLVDSYHNIWFECHEDFIQTLGRHRAAEGSF